MAQIAARADDVMREICWSRAIADNRNRSNDQGSRDPDRFRKSWLTTEPFLDALDAGLEAQSALGALVVGALPSVTWVTQWTILWI